MPIRMPTTISGHAISPPTMPLRQHRHQPGLGRGKLTIAETDSTAVRCCLVQQQQHRQQREAGHGDADEVADLHLGRACRRGCVRPSSPATSRPQPPKRCRPRPPRPAPRPRHACPRRPSAPSEWRRSPARPASSPEMGLFDEPIMPTRLPETAAKKKPTIIMTIAATIPGPQDAGVALVEEDHAIRTMPRPVKTNLAFRSRSVRALPA